MSKTLYQNKKEAFLYAFIVSALLTGLMIFFWMATLYAYEFFSLLGVFFFFFGVFLGNFLLFPLGVEIRSKPLLVIVMGALFLGMSFSFPFIHTSYIYYSYIRIGILFFVCLLGLNSFFLLGNKSIWGGRFSFFKLYSVLFMSILLTLFFQTYVSYSFMTLCVPFFLLFLAALMLVQKFLQLLVLLGLVFSSLVGFYGAFQQGIFFIKTSGSSESTSFELSNQIDLKVTTASDRRVLDISSKYEGELPTHKDIYINGRYYGQLIGNSSPLNYAPFTPFKVVYGFKETSNVLILDSAGGGSVYLTHNLTKGNIDALERSQEVLNQIRDKDSLYVGGIYHNRNTLFYRSSIRSYTSSTSKNYDVLALSYNINEPLSLPFLLEGEQVFSKEAIKNYLNILNPQGILFFNIKTFDKKFNAAIVLNIIKTLQSSLKVELVEDLLSSLRVFETENSLNLLFFKTEVNPAKDILYKENLDSLGYEDSLSPKKPLLASITALLKEDRNEINALGYEVKVMKDKQGQFFMKTAGQLGLWKKDLMAFSDAFLVKILSFFLLGLFIIFYLYKRQFTQTNLYKMGLGALFPYFCILGLQLGLGIVFGLDYFNFIISQYFISGVWVLATLFTSFILGIGICLRVKASYKQVILSFIFQGFVLFVLCLGDPFLRTFFIELSLILKIILPLITLSLIYLFSLSPFFSSLDWAKTVSFASQHFLVASFILGVLISLCIGPLLLFYAPFLPLLWIELCCVIVSCSLFLFLDKKYIKIDYLYSKERL